jgi:hypothetical protein
MVGISGCGQDADPEDDEVGRVIKVGVPAKCCVSRVYSGPGPERRPTQTPRLFEDVPLTRPLQWRVLTCLTLLSSAHFGSLLGCYVRPSSRDTTSCITYHLPSRTLRAFADSQRYFVCSCVLVPRSYLVGFPAARQFPLLLVEFKFKLYH